MFRRVAFDLWAIGGLKDSGGCAVAEASSEQRWQQQQKQNEAGKPGGSGKCWSIFFPAAVSSRPARFWRVTVAQSRQEKSEPSVDFGSRVGRCLSLVVARSAQSCSLPKTSFFFTLAFLPQFFLFLSQLLSLSHSFLKPVGRSFGVLRWRLPRQCDKSAQRAIRLLLLQRYYSCCTYRQALALRTMIAASLDRFAVVSTATAGAIWSRKRKNIKMIPHFLVQPFSPRIFPSQPCAPHR